MSELVERMRARLSEKRLAKPERIQEISGGNYRALGHTSKGNCAGNNNCGYSTVANVELLGTSRDYEGARADLRIACCLYLRARSYLCQNYMERAFLVFGVLLHEEVIEKWLVNYCIEPYPDVCCCGAEFPSSWGTVRNHCVHCRGHNVGLGYDMQRIGLELGIHYSWVEYGFAYALSQVGGAKR